jgi:hypothetical protein
MNGQNLVSPVRRSTERFPALGLSKKFVIALLRHWQSKPSIIQSGLQVRFFHG